MIIKQNDVLKEMWSNTNTKISLVITIVIAGLFLLGSCKFVIPSFEEQIMINIVDESKRVSNHLIRIYKRNKDFQHIHELQEDIKLEKLKLFDPQGLILYSTDKKDIGTLNTHDYYHNIVAKGKVFYKIVQKGKTTLENRKISVDVAEVYIPIMDNGKFLYAIELYYDITKRVAQFNNLSLKIQVISYFLTFLIILIAFLQLYGLSKTRLKDKLLKEQLYKSEKMASMGEMIANIAHQWRQPLSVISTAASGIRLQKQVGVLNDESLDNSLVNIVKNTEYLSNTIDTFSDFLKNEKEYKNIIIQDCIQNALQIVGTVLKDNHISFTSNFQEIEPISIYLIKDELSQVIINILNNAKDVLLEKDIHNPTINLELIKTDTSVTISIEDNGGGIEKDVIQKIFEPYFTTKHQSQGTGLGLYMSYKIITESLKGQLNVENTQLGAKFNIKLPLS